MNIAAFEKLPEERRSAILEAGINEFAACSYPEAGTDRVTAAAGISKGLLFHYFGSKREFYLYCLAIALGRLTAAAPQAVQGDMYGTLFAFMDAKLAQCVRLPRETAFVNMASRESSAEIAQGRGEILARYSVITRTQSEKMMNAAFSALTLKDGDRAVMLEALRTYISALMSKYLVQYQQQPEVFFQRAEEIKNELRRDIDLMLYGIAR